MHNLMQFCQFQSYGGCSGLLCIKTPFSVSFSDMVLTSARTGCPFLAWSVSGLHACSNTCCLQFGLRHASLLMNVLWLIRCRPLVNVRQICVSCLALVVSSYSPIGWLQYEVACGPPCHVWFFCLHSYVSPSSPLLRDDHFHQPAGRGGGYKSSRTSTYRTTGLDRPSTQ